MDDYRDAWVIGWMDGLMAGWMNGWKEKGRIDEWKNVCTGRWMGEWVDDV